jgi:putative RecB family exonuclease
MPVYSHSRLDTFETCPLKYKFRYIDKIKKPVEGVEAFVGKRVHEALQKLYDDLLFGKRNTVEELLAFYREQWKKNWGPGVQIVDARRSAKDHFNLGAECIRVYYGKNAPFGQSQTIATEERLNFPLDSAGRYQITGLVDRIARRDEGTYEIHDYKTSKAIPAQSEADTSRQLALYQIGIGSKWSDVQRVELIWHYVRFGVTQRSSRTAQQLTQLRETTAELIDRIESTKSFEPHKSRLCDWCEYKPDCPLWKHIVKVEALPPEEFKAEDGVRIADDYAQAKREETAIKERVEKLKEKIIAVAKQQDVKVLQGSSVRVSVSTRDRVIFPEKDEPERAQLELFLRKSGKWEEVATLSTAELRRVLEEEAWPVALLEKLGRFARREPGATVRIQASEEESE